MGRNRIGLLATVMWLGFLTTVAAACGSSAEAPKAAAPGGAAPTAAPGGAQAAPTAAKVSAKTLNIGATCSTSGASASSGMEQLLGLQYAVKKINDAGGVTIGGQLYTVNLIQYDDASQAETGVTMAQRLVNQDKVKVIFGATASTVALAQQKVTEEAKVIMILPVASAGQLITPSTKYTFRDTHTIEPAQKASIDFLQSTLGVKTMSSIARNDDAGKAGAGAAKEEMAKLGIKLLSEDFVALGTNDYYSLLTKIKGLNPDAIQANLLGNEGIPLVKQARELGIKAPIMGWTNWNSPDFINAVGDAGTEVYAYSSPFNSINDRTTAYKADIQKVMGKPSQTYDMEAYDALYFVLEAMKSAGTVEDTDKIGAAMRKISIDGVQGKLSFREDGQARLQLNINKLEGGKSVVKKEVPGDQLY